MALEEYLCFRSSFEQSGLRLSGMYELVAVVEVEVIVVVAIGRIILYGVVAVVVVVAAAVGLAAASHSSSGGDSCIYLVIDSYIMHFFSISFFF